MGNLHRSWGRAIGGGGAVSIGLALLMMMGCGGPDDAGVDQTTTADSATETTDGAVDSATDPDTTETQADTSEPDVEPDTVEDTAADTARDTAGDSLVADTQADTVSLDTVDAMDAMDTASDTVGDTTAATDTSVDTTPPCDVEAACCGDDVCVEPRCDGISSVIAVCANGCSAGRCLDCDPACDGSDCGADGCGGTCGVCEAGEVCVDGLCACTLTEAVTCCGDDALCLLDSCGATGPAVATCPLGCADGACSGCAPDCGTRTCGPDGCGGVCGPSCDGGAVCLPDGCECVETPFATCCGGDRCEADSCGAPGDLIETCELGCADGVCLTCAPSCAGRECGGDGCGGTCGIDGLCPGDATCLANGRCACAASSTVECCGDALCEVDACGFVIAFDTYCPYGCDGDACIPCEPDCEGRSCGDDGCGGTCGDCGPNEVCLSGGSCLPCVAGCGDRVCGLDACGNLCGTCGAGLGCDLDGACVPMVLATVRAVTRRPNSLQTTLLSPSEVAVTRMPVVAIAADGTVLGESETDALGRVRIVLAAPTAEAITLTAVASLADDAGDPILSIIDGAGIGFPQAEGVQVEATRVWAWSMVVGPGVVDAGTLRIDTIDGSGAANLFMQFRAMREEAEATFASVGFPGPMPSLAVLWGRNRSPLCLSCYFPENWGPLVLEVDGGDEIAYDRFIWLSGTGSTPYHWTPSMAGHEFGHFVMEIYSRSPQEGGAHSWTSQLRPGLAWSEGFATFWGQWWLSQTALQPRFFTQQSSTQYWIDIDSIGVTPNNDDSNIFGGGFLTPDPQGPITQEINEAVVAAIAWDLWDVGERARETDTVTLGDTFFSLLREPAILDPALERGYETSDLLDFLDALRCTDAVSLDAMTPVILGFPYDNDPLCTAP